MLHCPNAVVRGVKEGLRIFFMSDLQEGNFNSMEPEVRAAFGPKHPGAVEYFEGIRDKFCNQVWTPTDFYVYTTRYCH